MSITLLEGDCLQTLKGISDRSVQVCVTSPPYYALRDYGTARWEGGDSNCPHKRVAPDATKNKSNNNKEGTPFSSKCGICGAVRVDSQIGLEDTPEEYVRKLVEIFCEVWRVLKDDGTLWLNLGDSYCSTAPGTRNSVGQLGANSRQGERNAQHLANIRPETPHGMKPKDLMGIPWMVAFALRAEGWYLRSEIIWHKPNPMPESVTDRPTKSHEHIFLLSKSPKYYYDADAIKEPVTDSSVARLSQDVENQKGSERVPGKTNGPMRAVGGARSKSQSFKRDSRAEKVIPFQNKNSHRSDREENTYDVNTRNKRDVWTVTTKPYSEAHFATFPPDLIEPCILAGSRPGDVVLDPFNGAGTTGVVAIKHHRSYVGCELNPEYLELTRKRFQQVQPTLL